MSFHDFTNWREHPEPLAPVLSIIIPAYNESARIVPTIASIVAHLVEGPHSFELIVSDDGSTDDTAELCRSLELRNLRVVGDGINRGKGAAVRRGVQAAAGEWLLFTDADLSTPIEELDRMLEVQGADVIIGSRAADGASEQSKSPVRHALSTVSRRVVSSLLGLDVADSQCGFKLFSRAAARTLFAQQRIDGFGFDAEVLFLAKRNDLTVAEVPVRWIDAPGSTVDPLRAPAEFMRDLLRVRLLAAMGRYRKASHEPADGLHIAVVTALPPSTASLNEYGHHLVECLKDVDGVANLTVLAEDTNGVPESTATTTIVPAWSFDSLLTPVRLLAAVQRHRPDVVLFNLHFTSFASRKVAAAIGLAVPALLRLTGTPTVVLTHNLVDTTDLGAAGYSTSRIEQRVLMGIGRLLTRVLLRANHVVTTMPRYVEILRQDYGASNVSLTPHGAFDCPPFAPSDPESPRRLLAFGKFGTYKRVETLLDAVAELRAQPAYADVELVIAGTDSPTTPGYLASIATSLGDGQGVTFTGYVAEEDVATLFGDANIVVFPYTGTTGSSGPLHQAGSYSRPVVAPRIGDLLDLIDEEGYRAAAYEPGDAKSMSMAIAGLLDDPELMRSMGEQNHAAAVGLSLADVAEWHVEHLTNAVV